MMPAQPWKWFGIKSEKVTAPLLIWKYIIFETKARQITNIT